MKSDMSVLRAALASLAATEDRPKGVFMVLDISREAGCGTDKARRILHRFADDPGLELVKFPRVMINGRHAEAIGYRLKASK